MRPLLKYCGNHSLQDLRHVSKSGASYVGVVFANSRRQVEPGELAAWLKETERNNEQKLVGLFVNAAIEEIDAVVRQVPLDIIQCHGTESPEFVAALAEKVGVPIWKVIHHEPLAYEKMEAYRSYVTAFVIDSKVKGAWGGTGQSFDWTHIPAYIQEGKRLGIPVFIAGGINDTNIDDLLQYKPDGIDISSGIEYEGRKDRQIMKQIEERVKESEHHLS